MNDAIAGEVTLLQGALERLQFALEDVALRGVRVAGAAEISKLSSLAEEFRMAGAGHLAVRLDAVVQAISSNERSAVVCLLRAMTFARLFERTLTLEVCAGILEGNLQNESDVCSGEDD
jgi:hypothetical protein